MKRIKMIEELSRCALRRAIQSDEGIGMAWKTRAGRTLYKVTVNEENGLASLKHYDTTTVVYDFRRRKVLSWYGEGVSDRDSMNTFIFVMGEEEVSFRYGPSMGFTIEYGNADYQVAPNRRNNEILI